MTTRTAKTRGNRILSSSDDRCEQKREQYCECQWKEDDLGEIEHRDHDHRDDNDEQTG